VGRRKKGDPVHGWVCLDKPLELSSTAAVSRVRGMLKAQKAGHAGTLDPLATGVLPIALGEATKTMPFATDSSKSYRFTVQWGVETNTLDREGEVIATSDVRPTLEAAAEALKAFVGEIQQVPPAFSAIKVDGERAYDLARAGETVELAARTVTIHAARVVEAPDADHLTVEIDCGKGVYVRSLARDLATALGAVGHVSALRRTRVGPFSEDRAVPLEVFADLVHRGDASKALLPVETALDDIPAHAVTAEDAFRLAQGRSIVLLPRQVEALQAELSKGSANRTVSVFHEERLVALCELQVGRLNPVRVFNLQSGD
jgi:tRNA pseudouridine55 synthase